jgi:hypothetical protein
LFATLFDGCEVFSFPVALATSTVAARAASRARTSINISVLKIHKKEIENLKKKYENTSHITLKKNTQLYAHYMHKTYVQSYLYSSP